MQMTEKGGQQFNFTLAPQIKDRVPDVTFWDVNMSESISMSAFKGASFTWNFGQRGAAHAKSQWQNLTK